MPPNQFAQATSSTPGVERIVCRCEVGIEKIIDVERTVTTRVAELAADTAAKPSSTARSDENRNTASATLSTVSAVRRLLRRTLFSTRPTNFMASPPLRPFAGTASLFRDAGRATPARPHADRASP